MHSESKQLDWFSRQIYKYPITAAVIFIGIPQQIILYIIGLNQINNQVFSISYLAIVLIIVWIYTSYAAFLRGRTKWWWLWLTFWLIAVSLLWIKWEKNTEWLSSIQFLAMFWILWFGLHAIFNKDVLTGFIAVVILWFIVWYTKRHK